jgi:TIGR03009 family protein
MRSYLTRWFSFSSALIASVWLGHSGMAQIAGNTIQQPHAQTANPAAPMSVGGPTAPTTPQGGTGNMPGGLGQALPEAPMGVAPFPPLDPALQQYLGNVLQYWQQSTAKIQRYQCKFTRWQYDPTKVNDPSQHHSIAKGVVRYMAPDKGMFQVEDIHFLKQQPDGKFTYEVVPGQYGDWWILYDRTEKKAKKYMLPPSMQGAEVFNSPLPFVFGVDAEKIQARYWIRPLPPPVDKNGKQNDQIVLLEAYPKMQADALNYHHVTIYLDRNEFLPVAIDIALTQWTPTAPHREVFQFSEREVNLTLLEKINETLFRQAFIPREPPKDWTVEEVPFLAEEAPQEPLRASNPNAPPPNALQR